MPTTKHDANAANHKCEDYKIHYHPLDYGDSQNKIINMKYMCLVESLIKENLKVTLVKHAH